MKGMNKTLNSLSVCVKKKRTFFHPCNTLTSYRFTGKYYSQKPVNYLLARQASQLAVDANDINRIPTLTRNQKQGQLTIPDFFDHKEAFRSKSFLELLRAYAIFKLCCVEFLVNNQLKIFKWLRQITGKRIFKLLMKLSIYGQFLGGETKKEVMKQVEKNVKYGIVPMIAYTAAESHGHANDMGKNSDALKIFFADNAKAILNSVEMAMEMKDMSSLRPMCSSKITFLKSADCLKEISQLIQLNRTTIGQFKGKENMSTEAQEFMAMVQDCAKTCNMSSTEGALMNMRFHLHMKQKARCFQNYRKELDKIDVDVEAVINLSQILTEIGQKAEEAGVVIIWDTEQTYINPAIDVLVLDAMRVCNKNRATVHSTYQCYLKATYDDMVCDTTIAKNEGFCWGGKIVRGGYMEEERFLANKHGYEDPVNPGYDATTESYYKVINYLIKEIDKRPKGDIQMTMATHNTDTVKYAIQRLNEENISPGDDIKFAQLRGMRDYISFTLGQSGIPVAKLVHYGPVEDCVAYISRRVKENRSTFVTADFERKLLGKELRRRILRI